MCPVADQIIHESEVQRQHVRVEVPAVALINGKEHKIKDLSAGGFRIDAEDSGLTDGNKFECEIKFPFEGFNLETNLSCIVEHDDEDKKILGCAFVELNERQTSLISLIIKSTMTGTLITQSDVLHVVGRNNFVKPRSQAVNDSSKGKVKKFISLALLLLSGLVGLMFIAGNVYENVTILKSYEGVVNSTTIISRSNVDGVFHSLIGEDVEQVNKGEILAEIKGFALVPGGEGEAAKQIEVVTQIVSPCDCYILNQYAQDGEFRAIGESLFKLVPIDERPWVIANILPEDAQRLSLQDDARIRVAGESAFIDGYVVNFSATTEDTPAARVRVRPKTDLPKELIGRPAYVEFTVY